MPTLYEISQEYAVIEQMLEDREGDVTGIEAELDAWLENLGELRDEKIDGYCALIREFEAKAAARNDEAKRLYALAKSDQGNADRMKDRLREFLQRHGHKRLETERFKLTVCNNGGKAPISIKPGTVAADLSPEFQRITLDIDTEAARAALEAGKSLDWASLGDRGTHLRIK